MIDIYSQNTQPHPYIARNIRFMTHMNASIKFSIKMSVHEAYQVYTTCQSHCAYPNTTDTHPTGLHLHSGDFPVDLLKTLVFRCFSPKKLDRQEHQHTTVVRIATSGIHSNQHHHKNQHDDAHHACFSHPRLTGFDHWGKQQQKSMLPVNSKVVQQSKLTKTGFIWKQDPWEPLMLNKC